jgi:hypothetical protein
MFLQKQHLQSIERCNMCMVFDFWYFVEEEEEYDRRNKA